MFQTSLANISVTIELWIQVFWVISVQFDLMNTLPKSGPFLLLHSVYMPKYVRILKGPTCTYGHLLATFQCAYFCGLLSPCLNDEASVLKYCDIWLRYKILQLRKKKLGDTTCADKLFHKYDTSLTPHASLNHVWNTCNVETVRCRIFMFYSNMYGLQNNAVRSSEYVASNVKVI